MEQNNDISAELRVMGSRLADLSRSMPYIVPSGYFDGFADEVRHTITILNEPEATPGLSKSLPFSVPAGYFEEFAAGMAAKAAAGAAVSDRQMPLTVPAGYFDALPGQMLAAAKAAEDKKPARIIPFQPKKKQWSLRWAAAAVLFLTIGIGSAELFFNHPVYISDKILASVPSADIQDYLQHNIRIDVDKVMGNNDINNLQLENKDIIEYLDETGWD